MGALRPDLSIEAMIKIKMEAEESEVMGPYEHSLITDSKPPNLEMGQFYFKSPSSDQRSFHTS